METDSLEVALMPKNASIYELSVNSGVHFSMICSHYHDCSHVIHFLFEIEMETDRPSTLKRLLVCSTNLYCLMDIDS